MRVGDKVNYHSMKGEPVTSSGHKITDIETEPNNYGCDVAWITGKSGCVSIDNLSLEDK